MTDLFGRTNLRATARRDPAPTSPSDFSTALQSAARFRSEQGVAFSAQAALEHEYSKYLDEIEDLTGRRLPDPMAQSPRMRAKVEQRLQDEIAKLRQADPSVPLRTPESIRADIAKQRRAGRERRAAQEAREVSFDAQLGAVLGDAGMAMLDPPVLASMLFGAPAATGILRAMLIEAGAAGVGEALAQGSVQLGRRQFGEQPDLGEAAFSTATVAAGAGILTPVVRGGVAGIRALLQRSKAIKDKQAIEIAAERYLDRQVDLEDANPFDDTPAGRAEHVRRMSEAQSALRDGRPVRFAERARAVPDGLEPLPADREVSEIGSGAATAADTGAGRRLAGEVAGEQTPPPPRAARPASDPDLDLELRTGDVSGEEAFLRAEDEATEARVRAMAEAEPESRVTIEDGESIRALTARELLEELDDEAEFTDAVVACLRLT